MKDKEKAEERGKIAEKVNKIHRDIRKKLGFVDEVDIYLAGYDEGFKDCAKSRLNVTTISDCPIKEEWHDLEKDPNDLPKHTNSVLGYCRGDYYDVCFFNGKRLIGHGESDFLKWKEIE